MWDRLSSILGREENPQQVNSDVRIVNTNVTLFKVGHSVAPSDVKIAQDDLRIMEVEGGILKEAIRRIYEAEADGRISRGELENLAGRYKDRLSQIGNTIQHDRSIVALYDLERIQNDLMELANKHFNDLNKKIMEIRTRIGISLDSTPPSKEEKEPPQNIQKREKSQKERTREAPSTTEKSEADRRIEKIQAQIEETLGRLSQIEIEE